MKRFIAGIAAGAALFTAQPFAHAASGHDHGGDAAATQALSEGIVKRIDKSAGRVTLTHGPIANLNMPGMTMPFRLADPKGFERLKEGDKVRFRAEEKDDGLVIVRIEVLK